MDYIPQITPAKKVYASVAISEFFLNFNKLGENQQRVLERISGWIDKIQPYQDIPPTSLWLLRKLDLSMALNIS